MGVATGLGVTGEMAGLFVSLLSQEQEAAFRREQAKENIALANAAARDALARGGREAALLRGQGTDVAAQQKVAFAAGGIDPTVGTPAAVAQATRGVSELDALTAQNNAAREAWGFRVQAQRFARGEVQEAAALPLRQAGTVLTSFGRVASRYTKSLPPTE